MTSAVNRPGPVVVSTEFHRPTFPVCVAHRDSPILSRPLIHSRESTRHLPVHVMGMTQLNHQSCMQQQYYADDTSLINNPCEQFPAQDPDDYRVFPFTTGQQQHLSPAHRSRLLQPCSTNHIALPKPLTRILASRLSPGIRSMEHRLPETQYLPQEHKKRRSILETF